MLAVTVAGVLALAATACDRNEEDAPLGATVPTAGPTTTTTDPYAVPDLIDVGYVNRVLAGLDAVDGDVFRLYLRERRISPEISARIKALYSTEEKYDRSVRELEAEREAAYSQEPGNRITTVTRLITATPTCIYAQVARDYRPVGGTVSNLVAWVGLRPATPVNDPAHYNPTPWIYVSMASCPTALSRPTRAPAPEFGRHRGDGNRGLRGHASSRSLRRFSATVEEAATVAP
ncbi:MAG: hypothetical protein ABR540_03040 [Acidimicrobiales bacterium]